MGKACSEDTLVIATKLEMELEAFIQPVNPLEGPAGSRRLLTAALLEQHRRVEKKKMTLCEKVKVYTLSFSTVLPLQQRLFLCKSQT